MPIFEYQCRDCGHVIDVLVRASEPAPKQCPKCKHPTLERKLSTFSSGGNKPDNCSPRRG
ncbi:MAG: zinc ribbon domain-containing protein [Phycisphaerae bacterium]|nr:zinc ribbon domain-containing protein [Phycisphaerae bacterium]